MKESKGLLRMSLITAWMLFISIGVMAQASQITGTVVDANNDPVIGVSVSVKGTTNGTITDIDGNFKLEVNEGTLVATYLGYTTVEIPIDGRTNYRIVLREDTKALDEVVVVGYGSQSKRNVTGAVSDLKSEDLLRTASTSTSGALAGKMPGISVRAKDARPGKAAALEIRNMGDPLFVIDGIPYGGETGGDWLGSSNISGNDAFNALNLEDIESITILKDASAAIYGLRAANGVVLVTTKKGTGDEKPRVNINGYLGWQNLTRFPKLANAAQYTRAWVEAEQNAGISPENFTYSKEELAKWQAGTEPGYQGYDYYDMVMRKNIPQHYINANVTGGSKKSSYYLSVSHTGQDALMKDFSYERTNVQANIEAKITDGLTIGTQISGKQEVSKDVGLPGGDGYFASILGMFSNIPTVGPYANDNPDYINHTRDFSRNPAIFHRDIAGYKDNIYRNANINLYAEYKFKFGLKAKGTVSYNYTHNKFDGFQYTYDVYTYDKANNVYNRTGGTDGRWRNKNSREVVAKFGQIQLDYSKQLDDHYFSATFAYERSDYDKKFFGASSAPSNNYLPPMEYDKLTGLGDDWTYQARIGYIGRINYNYLGKYLVELLGRYDASYLYAPGERWGFFPGASIGWRISEEPFFKGAKDIVNDLKIRASIGQTGKEEGLKLFDYMGGYTWNQGNAILDDQFITGLKPRGLPIRNLTWVKNTNYNIGIDLSMVDNKLKITADAFKIIRTGVPAARYDVLLPNEVGYTLPNENLNKNGYYGAEGMITYTDKLGDVNYVVSGNVTYSRFKRIESYKPRFGNSWDEYRNSAEGRWDGIWWGYQVIGRFESEEQIRNYPVMMDEDNNRTLLPGDFIYKDVNGDGVINGMDERPIGYPTGWAPMLSFGGRIGLEWKGIDLNIDFAGGAMQSWCQDYELRNAFHGGGNSPAYLFEDRWHRADPYDPNSEWIPGYYPAIRNGNSGPNHRNSDFWLTNVRYLRVRNLELGYTFPKHLISKIHAEKLRVYVSGSNLLSFDNVGKFEIDPEIEARAAVVYPQQRTFLVGLNVTF